MASSTVESAQPSIEEPAVVHCDTALPLWLRHSPQLELDSNLYRQHTSRLISPPDNRPIR